MNVIPGEDDPSELVLMNRSNLANGFRVFVDSGITLGSTVRRRPNCFNLLRQLNMLERMGRVDVGSLEA